MKNKISNTLIGLCFIALGVLFLGNVLDWWTFNIFFDGWWTLFIIIPCVASVISNGIQVGNLIGVGVGIILLLWQQDVFSFSSAIKIIFPSCFVLIGIAIIVKSFSSKQSYSGYDSKAPTKENATAIFGGAQPNFSNLEFKGINSTAIFGGVDLNLKTAIINEDCRIDCTAIFGGIDIILPPNVKVKLSTTPILGGVENKYISSPLPDAPVVYINATCILGGLEIK